MLHTKFHENRPAGSGEEDFYVTWISRSNFRPPNPLILHIKFHFDWPSSLRRRSLKSVYGRQTGQGQEMTLT